MFNSQGGDQTRDFSEDGGHVGTALSVKLISNLRKGRPLAPYSHISSTSTNSHRSNALLVCNRNALTSEKFGDVELKEITTQHLLEARAPGEFDVRTSKDAPSKNIL